MPNVLSRLRIPIVQAPLAGGPSSPELTIAVSRAGAFGFPAGGYRTIDGGKRARGLVNGFMERHEAAAINLWAGQGGGLMQHDVFAARVIETMARGLRDAFGLFPP